MRTKSLFRSAKNGSFFVVTPKVKVNEQGYLTISTNVSYNQTDDNPQMINFVFHQDSEPAHRAHHSHNETAAACLSMYAADNAVTTTETILSSLSTGEVTPNTTLLDTQQSGNSSAQVITIAIGKSTPKYYTPVMAIMCTECVNSYDLLTVFKCAFV